MGQIADTLRATLRDLALSDARLYRGLQDELADASAGISPQPPLLDDSTRASRAELEALSIKALWTLCKQRGITGLSKGPVQQQVEALLNHPDGPPLRSSLPVKASKGGKGGGALTTHKKVASAEQQLLERRLDRLEQLVLLIAQQVGVPQDAIAQCLKSTT